MRCILWPNSASENIIWFELFIGCVCVKGSLLGKTYILHWWLSTNNGELWKIIVGYLEIISARSAVENLYANIVRLIPVINKRAAVCFKQTERKLQFVRSLPIDMNCSQMVPARAQSQSDGDDGRTCRPGPRHLTSHREQRDFVTSSRDSVTTWQQHEVTQQYYYSVSIIIRSKRDTMLTNVAY